MVTLVYILSFSNTLMEIKLTSRQEELLKEAKKKGFLTLEDFKLLYSHPPTRRDVLERFIQVGFLKESNTPGKFDYIGGKK